MMYLKQKKKKETAIREKENNILELDILLKKYDKYKSEFSLMNKN